jgi:ribose transport system ATP-binding protein
MPPDQQFARRSEKRSPVSDRSVPILAAKDVTHAFGPVTVLHSINIDFLPGEVHAIVGENGAGKSTLMKILSGIIRPSHGEVFYSQKPVETGNLRKMEDLGVRLIHQELNLAEDLTVLENLFLGEERTWGPFLDESGMRAKGREILTQVGLNVPLNRTVRNLRVSEKQLIEIAKAISQRVTALILDEPTATLTRQETERLFQIINSFAVAGVAILYVSHRLEEVKQLSHRISILRDGRLVTTQQASELSPNEIVRLMVGRSLLDLFPRKVPRKEESIALEVRGLSVPGAVSGASFTLGKGEILGFAGLIGAGRTELWEAVLGIRKISQGKVLKDGKEARPGNYSQALERLRAVYLPEDRKGKGLVVSFDAKTNYSLLGLKRFGSWFVDERREQSAFEQAVDQFQIKVPDRSMSVSRLSGGNQQKVLMAKILALNPEIIVFDEPTRGIDVGTKAQIYHLIAEMAAKDRACVVISSELLEIIGLCHRVIVMRSQRIVASLEAAEINEDEIMLYATGVKSPQPAYCHEVSRIN